MKIPEVRFPSIGKCIYCGVDDVPLSAEHVIPLSFGGHYVLPEASCQKCSDMTAADEGQCCSIMLRALRVHQEFPTRRPKKRPKTLRVLDGTTEEGKRVDEIPFREVPVTDAPGVVVLPIFQPPGILLGLPPRDQIESVSYAIYGTTEDAEQRQKRLLAGGVTGAAVRVSIPVWPFLRTLAKIARGYDIVNFGIASPDDTLNSYILRKDEKIPFLVGGTPPNGPIPTIVPLPQDGVLHQIYPFGVVVDDLSYIAIQIRLFAHLRPPPPVYTVIMRRHHLEKGGLYFTIVTKK